MESIEIPIPEPGSLLIVGSDGVAWAAVRVSREFLDKAESAVEVILEAIDRKIAQIQADSN